MRVVIITECRYKAHNDKIYAEGALDYDFLTRYLQVYDSVLVCARFGGIEGEAKRVASGPGVTFCQLPAKRGIGLPIRGLQWIWRLRKVVKETDVVIMRIPGLVSTVANVALVGRHLSWGVEVVGDPDDAFGPTAFEHPLQPLIRWLMVKVTGLQCRYARQAAYVTAEALQEKYPPGGGTTHYSSVEIKREDLLTPSAMRKRLKRLRALTCPASVCGQPSAAVQSA